MGYSTGYFSEFGPFLKMAITQKFELRISSNFLHSIRTSYVSENAIKKFCDFGAIFWKKSMGYSTGYFQKLGDF